NRDTSDAPLWYGLVCEEALRYLGDALLDTVVNSAGRTISEILRSIALGYIQGTANGIRMDPVSGLTWSPSHFTWMDTNYPAGTPREGYPIEIQALWIRLLQQLAKISPVVEQKKWGELANRAIASFEKLFWLEDNGWFADVLIG